MNNIKEPPYIPNSKVWKKILTKNYKFTYIDSLNKIPSNALWSTSCSKTKTKLKNGYPSELYLSKYNLLFYKYAESLNFDYGIISDKYGIHLQNEKLQNYDIHPNKLSFEDKFELGQKIKVKVENSGYENLIFYYPSPLMSKPYFQMLWYANIPVCYISNIKMLKKRI